ncbi:MAG: hypothetical protein ACRDK3_15360 [Actinomycetota bacterium]
MSPVLLAAIALLTYGSRAAALAFLPRPSGRLEVILGRMPAPIFASLATLTLITEDGALTGGPILVAALGALLMSPKRSLAVCLAGGIVGYAVGALVL